MRKGLTGERLGRMKAGHRILDPSVPESGASRLCALAVMTKAPRAGRVKTRLVPPLTPDEAAELNTCFLRDTAVAITEAAGEISRGIAVYTPIGAEAAYIDILPASFELVPQRGGEFGKRLACAAQDLFHIGFQSVCLIDSDSPTVPASFYAETARLLSIQGDRVVVGPADDGGYYLIGLKKNHRALFEGIDWSTDRVLDQTRQRASELDLAVELLPICYDVDDRVSLRRLCADLFGSDGDHPAEFRATETRNYLAAILKREGRARVWPM